MDFSFHTLDIKIEEPVARVFINRPNEHNSFNAKVIEELTLAFGMLGEDSSVRFIILGGNGRSFSAGADLSWMKSMAEMTEKENIEDAKRMAQMFHTIFRCPKPTIARVHGAALGGAMGLIAACDIAIASDRARFGFTEVRLGIAPAVISPYVLYKISPAAAHRYFLTGERFDALQAFRMGIITAVHEESELDSAISQVIYELRQGAPEAQAHIKWLISRAAAFDPDAYINYTCELIASMRAGKEGQEGMRGFLEHTTPSWVLGGIEQDSDEDS